MRQMHTPPLSKINKILIIIGVALFLLNSILIQVGSMNIVSLFGLSVDGLKSGFIWQFLTYPFMETSFMGIIFNSLLLWFIGGELEQNWGQKFYLQFIAIAVLSSSIAYLFINLVFLGGVGSTLIGLNSICYGLLIAYGMIYSERQLTFMLLFPMKAKYFCMLLAGILLYMGIFSPQGVTSLAHVASMLFCAIFLRYRSFKAQGGSLKDMQTKRRREKAKAQKKLYIVNPEEEKPNKDDPKYWQ